MELNEDHVLAGASLAAQDAEDFDLHGLGFGAGKDGPGGGGHAAMHLAEGEEAAGGRGRAGGCVGCLRDEQDGDEQERGQERESGGQRESPDGQGGTGFLQARSHVYIEYREGAGLQLTAHS